MYYRLPINTQAPPVCLLAGLALSTVPAKGHGDWHSASHYTVNWIKGSPRFRREFRGLINADGGLN